MNYNQTGSKGIVSNKAIFILSVIFLTVVFGLIGHAFKLF